MKMAFRLDDAFKRLETILGEAIDDDVLSIVNSGSFQQSIEFDDKFCPQLRREKFVVNRGLRVPQPFSLFCLDFLDSVGTRV